MICYNDSNLNFIFRICAVTLIACLFSHFVADSVQSQNHVPWGLDLEKAKQIASEQDKPILLHFSANWCAPCKELDRFVFVNPMTIRAINDQVVPVKVDVDLHTSIAEEYDIKSVPTDVIITPAGHVIASRKSPRSADGYQEMIARAVKHSKDLTQQSITNRDSNRQSTKMAFHPTSKPTSESSLIVQKNSGAFPTAGTKSTQLVVRNTEFQPKKNDDPSQVSRPSIVHEHNQDAVASSDPVALKPAATESKLAAAGPSPEHAKSKMAVAEPSSKPTKTNLPQVGLDGYCCVSLIQQQTWVKGDSRFGCIHRGKLYLFKSEEKRELFQKTPDMFSPLLSGADPVEFQQSGQLTDGQRKHGVFYGDDGGPNVIVLFKNKSNRDKFENNPSPFLTTVRQAMSKLDEEKIIR